MGRLPDATDMGFIVLVVQENACRDTGNSRSRRPCLHHITHCTSLYLYRRSPYGTNSKKNGLSAFDWSHTDFRTVADLQTRSIDGVNMDDAVRYPCGRFPVLLLRIGTTSDDLHLD